MIFNKNKLRKKQLQTEIDTLEKEVYDLKKSKAKLQHNIEMDILEREKKLERNINKFENEKQYWKDNQENIIRIMKTETEILKEELNYIKKYKTLRTEAKQMSEKDLVFETLEKVKEITHNKVK